MSSYDRSKLESCLGYVDSEQAFMKRRVWPDVDVYALWSKATPESLDKLESIGAIHNAKRLAAAMDYCAEHYDQWESESSGGSGYSDGDGDDYEYNGKPMLKTRAAFQIKGRWKWVTWTHHHGNKHAAIIEKAKELGADRWDYGNADHGFVGDVNF